MLFNYYIVWPMSVHSSLYRKYYTVWPMSCAFITISYTSQQHDNRHADLCLHSARDSCSYNDRSMCVMPIISLIHVIDNESYHFPRVRGNLPGFMPARVGNSSSCYESHWLHGNFVLTGWIGLDGV
jgi:hypothetical protein